VRRGLVIGGAVTLGTTWLITAISGGILMAFVDAVGEDSSPFAPLLVPAVGPFIAIPTLQPSPAGIGFLVIDGVIQSGGLAMLIVGIAVPKKVLIRNDAMGPSFTVTPMMVGRGTMGLGIVGTM
jgi:hypothetical protein